MTEDTNSSFVLHIAGQIEYAKFPLIDNIYCKYSYVFGNEWEQVAGLREGISSKCTSGTRCDKLVIGLPLEATFKSKNPHGWPQICVSCYGFDSIGNDVPRGYGAIHFPTTPGRKILKISMHTPEGSTFLQKWLGILTGRRAEFVDPRFPATADSRNAARVSTRGFLFLTVNLVLKNMKNLGYDVQSTGFTDALKFPLPNFEARNGGKTSKTAKTLEKSAEVPRQPCLTKRVDDDAAAVVLDDPDTQTNDANSEPKLFQPTKKAEEKEKILPRPLPQLKPVPLPRLQVMAGTGENDQAKPIQVEEL